MLKVRAHFTIRRWKLGNALRLLHILCHVEDICYTVETQSRLLWSDVFITAQGKPTSIAKTYAVMKLGIAVFNETSENAIIAAFQAVFVVAIGVLVVLFAVYL